MPFVNPDRPPTDRLAWLALLVAVCAGCGASAVRTSEDLPVRKVVLYRNGVGYFERSGRFDGSQLQFQVRQSEVGDFLSSLTAIEHTSGGVRSVSFDVPQVEEEETEPNGEQPLLDVRLHLATGGQHAVSVAYVVEAPIWRPSYRVVLKDGSDALLQAWAVVQNTSGEDWQDVALSLTTGAPIAFRSDLGTPVRPHRPLVTDTGEVIATVPRSETALRQQGEADSVRAPAPEPEPRAVPMTARSRRAAGDGSGSVLDDSDALTTSVQSMAAVAVLGEGVTRYDLEQPVTVPDGGSTMVAVLSTRVPGEEAHLFAPDPGVPLSQTHPFSVVRLENRTDSVLERGTVSVLGRGAFLGQGVLETLPRDAHAFVPFAVDRSVMVEHSQNHSRAFGQLVRVLRDRVTVQQFSERVTRYTVRNGGAASTKVYVRHARWGDATLTDPPEGTELSAGRALIPVWVSARGEADLTVLERTPVETQIGLMTSTAADAIKLWLSGPAVDAVQGPALGTALKLREELLNLQDRVRTLERKQRELQGGAEETRKNLKAIEKVPGAVDLRSRLLKRLKNLDAELAQLTTELVEARTRQSELNVRMDEALSEVDLRVP